METNNLQNKDIQEATFGAGCFWSVEEVFRTTYGVIDTEVGFMGGNTKNPSYKEVCNENTGHAEVVHMHYDSDRVTYEELLNIFWENHNPTQLNKQGPDVGEQYRSVIFYYTDEQKRAALASKQALMRSVKHDGKIVTVIEPVADFCRAEEDHQKYLKKRGLKTCH